MNGRVERYFDRQNNTFPLYLDMLFTNTSTRPHSESNILNYNPKQLTLQINPAKLSYGRMDRSNATAMKYDPK